jgi:hypothetical protein
MVRVLACDLPSAFDAAPPPSLASYTPAASRRDLTRLADMIGPELGRGSTIVAVLQERAAEPLHARLLALRSAFATTRLLVHRTALPPLAAGLLVRTVLELGREVAVAPTVLATGMARLERLVAGAAWLGSVARLQHPNPSVGMHARSLLPGAGFGAVVDADPRVVRLGRDGLLPLPALTPPDGWRVILASAEGTDVAPVERTLATKAPGSQVTRVPLSATSVAWWGTSKLVEVAYAPRDPMRLYRQLLGEEGPSTCDWCTEVVAQDPCPLCRARSQPAPPSQLVPGGLA